MTKYIARQKRCIGVQTKVVARTFYLCNSTLKTTLFNSYCSSMYTSSLWCNLKKTESERYYNFIISHNVSPRCSASHMFATSNVKSFNECICSSIFSLLCWLEKSENILFVNYFHTFIYYRSPMIIYIIITYFTYIFTAQQVCIYIFFSLSRYVYV